MPQLSSPGRVRRLIAISWPVLACLSAAGPVQAQLEPGVQTEPAVQTYTLISSFTGDPNPQYPVGALVQGRNGNMYGSSYYGGVNNDGAIFEVTPAGAVTVIYSFAAADGGPCDSTFVLGTDGNFYGTCSGGSSGDGFVFEVTPAGIFSKLHSFTGVSPDGSVPEPLTRGTDGNFYGVTVSGGANNLGTFFKITPKGVLTTVYSFASSAGQPSSGVIQGADGNFYGSTSTGGDPGTLFKVTPGGVLSTLYAFTGAPDGSQPTGVTQGTDGNFYGATRFGGSNNQGSLFKVTAAGKETILHNFNSATDVAAFPVAPLVQAPDGNFYGQTCDDNQFNSCGGPNHEALYEITPKGAYTTVHVFAGPPNDGQQPFAAITPHTNGTLYSFTEEGGSAGDGAFYSLKIGAAPFVSLIETSGKVGSAIGIEGQGFSASSVVRFDGVPATAVTLTGSTYLSAEVPAGASNGHVTVTTGAATLTSSQTFTVHDSWSGGAALPTGVHGPGAGFAGGKIYVVSGVSSTGLVGLNQVYDPSTNVWSAGAALPTPVYFPASAVVGGVLYMFGGYMTGSFTATGMVQAYDPKTNTWSTKASMPTARGSAAAVVDGGLVYVIGGNGATDRLATVEAYDVATNTWTEEAPLLVGKSEASAGALGKTIVDADGYTAAEDTGDNEAYSIAGNSWAGQTQDPTPRNESCFGVMLGQLYAAGGAQNGNAESLTESFSTATNKWTAHTAMPQPVRAAASAIADGRLYCFGGTNTDSATGTAFDYVQIYQP